MAVNLCQQLYQILTDFQSSFIVRLSDKFSVKGWLQTPPHLKCVITLPCEILISENKRQYETGTVINYKS